MLLKRWGGHHAHAHARVGVQAGVGADDRLEPIHILIVSHLLVLYLYVREFRSTRVRLITAANQYT